MRWTQVSSESSVVSGEFDRMRTADDDVVKVLRLPIQKDDSLKAFSVIKFQPTYEYRLVVAKITHF
jgi:hypothetical protein